VPVDGKSPPDEGAIVFRDDVPHPLPYM